MATVQDCVQFALEQSPRSELSPDPVASPNHKVSTVVRYFPVQSFEFGPAPGFLDRGDEVRYAEGAPAQLVDGFQPPGRIGVRAYVNDLTWLLSIAGLVGVVTAGDGTSDVQTITITGSPTGGTFTLTFGGQTTIPLPFNATAAQVESALNALSSLGAYSVACTGGPLPGTGIVVTFQYGGNQAVITHADSLTGGATPAVVVTHTTPGTGAVLDPTGRVVLTGANRWQFLTRTGITPKTAQMLFAWVNGPVYFEGSGFGISSATLTADGAFTGDLMGLFWDDLPADPNLVPSYDSATIPPLRRGDFSIPTWLANTGETEDWSISIANPFERVKTLNASQSYYPDKLERNGRVRLSGSIPKRVLAGADMDALEAGGSFAALAKWITPSKIGATNQHYATFCEMPACQIVGGGMAPLVNQPRIGANFDFWAARDEAAGYDFRITLIDSVASIASAGVGL